MDNKHSIIRLRRGTSSEWANSQPQPGGEVLKLGEPGYEKDTGKLKIGDGVTPWNSLSYFNNGATIDQEALQDLIGSTGFLVAGDGISITYDDDGNQLIVANNKQTYDAAVNWTTNHTLADGTRYLAGDLVYKNGRLYKANYDNESIEPGIPGNANSELYWTDVGPGYRLNIDGRDIPNITADQVTNLDEIISDTLDTSLVAGNGIALNFDDVNNTLAISTSGVAFSVHPHTSSDITNFDTAVSGLIPVKDIVAGTGVGVTSSSGIYTINSSNTIATDTLEPDGFINRTDSQITFNNGSREFSISPKAPATSYGIYNNGIKVTKNSTETIALPNSTALYYIHFDKSDNSLSYKTTGIDFSTDIPIAQIYYNSNDGKAVYFGEERHGIRMDAATHKYLHNVFGTQYINGLNISNYTLTGTGSSNSDATVAIGDGVIYDEDIEANITHSDTPSNPFEQVLYPTAQIPVYYKVGASGVWTDTTPTDYPVKTGTTIQYNLDSAGTWSASDSPNPTNNRYIAYWICATTQENAPIISIMGQRIDSSIEQATSNNSWDTLNLSGLPIVELRPLYRLIYDTKSSFTNSPKGYLANILDIRSHIDTVTGLTQNDHGNLYGLADDDHYQYVHIDNSRTISANHTFSNGFTVSGGTVTGLTKSMVGLSNVDNTSDANKPVSTATQNALNLKSDINTPIFALGTLSGSNAINFGSDRMIQTLTLDGNAVTFTKGTGWPSGNTSVDIVLRITVTSATSITWTVVNDWFNQPPAGALSIGTHLFLLRGIGSSIIEGHYIGNKTN